MRKKLELTTPGSCMSRATDDEMTFVLLGRDAAAPVAIRAWVGERVRIGKNRIADPQIKEALECANVMELESARTGLPSAADLDRHAEEERIKAATSGSSDLDDFIQRTIERLVLGYEDLPEMAISKLRPVFEELYWMNAELNTPETEDFFKGIVLEAAHQRQRWPSEQDAGKTAADWFGLIGYLAGKCLHAAIAGDRGKALHHTISTGAALANWHRAMKGVGNMRPGIATPVEGSKP